VYTSSLFYTEKKTPPDPHLHQLFIGEEISKFARLWTRGYDVYTPNKNIAFHDYTEAVVDPFIGPMRPGGNIQHMMIFCNSYEIFMKYLVFVQGLRILTGRIMA
jgi:hypothetical protein